MIRQNILRATCPRCGYIKEVNKDNNWASAFVRGIDDPKCPACRYPEPPHEGYSYTREPGDLTRVI